MQKAKRSFILFTVIAISCLSAYLTLDLVDFIFNNGDVNFNRLSQNDGIVFIFTLSISVLGIISTIFNLKLLLLKQKTSQNESDILDSEEEMSQNKHSGFLYISYHIFGLLIFAFGVFFVYLFIKKSNRNYTVNADVQFLIVTLIILLIGALFLRDARKL